VFASSLTGAREGAGETMGVFFACFSRSGGARTEEEQSRGAAR